MPLVLPLSLSLLNHMVQPVYIHMGRYDGKTSCLSQLDWPHRVENKTREHNYRQQKLMTQKENTHVFPFEVHHA